MAPPEPPLEVPVSGCCSNSYRGQTYFVRGPVKVLRVEGVVRYTGLVGIRAKNCPNSPKQTFPGTQNGAAEADDRYDAEVALRLWSETGQQAHPK
jgi:hypothetical protein